MNESDDGLTPWRDSYSLGKGVDTLSGTGLNLVLAKTEFAEQTGEVHLATFKRVSSTSEVEDALGVSVEGSGGVGPFSASAKMNYAQESKVQSSSICLMIHDKVVFGFRKFEKYKIDEDAAKIIDNPQQFQASYGDAFVGGYQSSALFIGIVVIETKSNEAKKSIEGSLSGSYGPFSAEVSSKLSQAMKETNSTATCSFFAQGGVIKDPGKNKDISPEMLMDVHSEWSTSLHAEDGSPRYDRAVPDRALIFPYKVALGPEPPNAADIEKQRDVLIRCANRRVAVRDSLNVLDYIWDHAADYDFNDKTITIEQISKLQKSLASDLDMIQKAASAALNSVKDAAEPEVFAERTSPGYLFTAVPASIPVLKGGDSAIVPHFADSHSRPEAQKMASLAGVTLVINYKLPMGEWQILNQDKAPGTPIAAGSTVTIDVPKPDWRKNTALGGTHADTPLEHLGGRFALSKLVVRPR